MPCTAPAQRKLAATWPLRKRTREIFLANLPRHSSTHLLHGLLDLLFPVVELVLELLGDLLEELLREDAQQCPSDVQGSEDVPILVGTLRQELRLELVSELEVLVLIFAESLLADHSLHGPGVLPDGII